MYFSLIVIFSLASLFVSVCCAANIPAQSPNATWVGHLDVILPGVLYAFKVLIGVIGSLGSLIGAIIWYFAKQHLARQRRMERMLTLVYHVITECDGCKETLDNYEKHDRRKDDVDFGTPL